MIIEILGAIIIFFVGMGFGIHVCDKDLQKDVLTGLLKVKNTVYKVTPFKKEEETGIY
jgi:hypothetical protein